MGMWSHRCRALADSDAEQTPNVRLLCSAAVQERPCKAPARRGVTSFIGAFLLSLYIAKGGLGATLRRYKERDIRI